MRINAVTTGQILSEYLWQIIRCTPQTEAAPSELQLDLVGF